MVVPQRSGWRQHHGLPTGPGMRMWGRWGMRGSLDIVGVCDLLRKEPRTGDLFPNRNKQHWHGDCPFYAWLMVAQKLREYYCIGSSDNE